MTNFNFEAFVQDLGVSFTELKETEGGYTMTTEIGFNEYHRLGLCEIFDDVKFQNGNTIATIYNYKLEIIAKFAKHLS